MMGEQFNDKSDDRDVLGWGGFDAGERPEATTPGDLLRRAADGELTEGERAALETHLSAHPQDQARIDFDRALSQRAARLMGEVQTPAGLRDRVMAAARADVAAEDALADALERRAEQTRSPATWRKHGGVLAAAAAMVLLVTTAVLMRPSPGGDDANSAFATAVSFVGQEHAHCVTDLSHSTDKFRVVDPSEAPAAVRDVTGEAIDFAWIPRLVESGFDFEGGGPCGVPGGPSFHMSFVGSEDSEWSGERVSLFVQVARDASKVRLDLSEGVTYKATRKAAAIESEGEASASGAVCEGAASVFFWRHADAVYYLVTDAQVCDKPARRAFEAPELTEPMELRL